MPYTSPYTWAKSLTKFNPEMQQHERVLDLKCKKKQFQFFNWLSNVKNLVLSNGSKHMWNVIQWH